MGKIFQYGLVLMTIALISGAALAFVNQKTVAEIDKIDKKLVETARKEVLKEALKFDENNKLQKDGIEFIPGYNKAGEKVGYVASYFGMGYAGEIKFVIGIGTDYKVRGLKIVDSKETPGLGAKIMQKVKGKDVMWGDLWIGKDKNYLFDKSEMAFAGATVSPMGVYGGVIKVLKAISNSEENIDEKAGATNYTEGDNSGK